MAKRHFTLTHPSTPPCVYADEQLERVLEGIDGILSVLLVTARNDLISPEVHTRCLTLAVREVDQAKSLLADLIERRTRLYRDLLARSHSLTKDARHE